MALDRRICLRWLGAGAVLTASGLAPLWAQDPVQSRVSLMIPGFDGPIVKACQDGAGEAAKELGSIALTLDMPAKPTHEEQIKLVTALIAQKVAAIALHAVDGAALVPVCRRAMQRGINIIAIETPLPDACLMRIAPVDLSVAGRTCLQSMAKSLGGKGRIGVFGSADGRDATALLAAMKQEWVKPVYDGLKLAATRLVGDAEVPYAAQNLLRDHSDLDGIIALDPACLAAGAKAVASTRIRVTGLGLPSQMLDFVKSGVCENFLYWNPVDLGYAATTLAGLAATGRLSAAPDTSVTVGRLGSLTIAKNLTMTIVPTIFDSSNIERYAKTF